MEEKIRAFISLGFPDEVIKEITKVQQVLDRVNFTGKLTEPENLHITLKFLGEISPKQMEEAQKRLAKITFRPLRLKLVHAGTFEKKGKPRIVWIKVDGDVMDLQKQVDKALGDLHKPEARFMSHLTIARIKYVKDTERFRNYVRNLGVKRIPFTVRDFKLRSSELRPEGPIYQTIQTFEAR